MTAEATPACVHVGTESGVCVQVQRGVVAISTTAHYRHGEPDARHFVTSSLFVSVETAARLSALLALAVERHGATWPKEESK